MQPVRRTTYGGQAGCLLILGLIFTLASCGGLAIASPALMPALSSGNLNVAGLLSSSNLGSLIGGGIFALAFLIVGVVMLGFGGTTLLARARLTRPEVSLSNQNPRVGEVVTLNYQQTFKSATQVQSIRYQLILRESATYRRGTDTVTVTFDNVAQEYQVPARHFSSGEGFQEQRQFQVGRMHTFEASRNKLNWLIHVQVDMDGWPSFKEEYPLQVAPELAR
jgi:hypothetical protein